MFRLLQTSLMAVCLFFISSGLLLADDLNIHFAGFAFRGEYADIQKNYPNVFALSQEILPDGRGALDAALGDKLRKTKLKNARIEEGALANLGDGSLTLACAFDSELIDIENYEDGYKVVIDLGAQILLFDYTKMRLVASFPVIIELIDFVKQEPNDEYLENAIRDLFLTQKYEINIFSDFVKQLSMLELKQTYSSTLKVTRVDIQKQATIDLPSKFSADINNFKTFVAQGFGKYLSINQRVAILPYAKGSDIGNKMALTFSETKVFQLKIPEPHFAVELSIDKFKKVCTEQKASGACWVYGTFANIRILQPKLKKIYVDEKIKKGVSKIISRRQISVQDWPSYQNSLLALFNEVTQQLSTEKKFKKARKVIKKCI